MVVTNHPLASAAGTEIMLAGGNAIDAAVASLFALTVVEPMMIGVLGGGIQHIRLANGRHHIVDSLGTAPLAHNFKATATATVGGRDRDIRARRADRVAQPPSRPDTHRDQRNRRRTDVGRAASGNPLR